MCNQSAAESRGCHREQTGRNKTRKPGWEVGLWNEESAKRAQAGQGWGEGPGLEEEFWAQPWASHLQMQALSPCRPRHTGQKNNSLLPELDCCGFVVFWACSVLEVCMCLRGQAAQWCWVWGWSGVSVKGHKVAARRPEGFLRQTFTAALVERTMGGWLRAALVLFLSAWWWSLHLFF